MRRFVTLGGFAIVVLVFAHSPAAAQRSPQPARPPGGSSAQAGQGSQNDDVARGLFLAGKAAYEAGNYTDALQFFEQAHARSGRPQLLFNVGQAADRLRQDEKTLAAFREYLQLLPGADNRVEVENRIAALERAQAEREQRTQVAVPTPAQTAAQAQTGNAQPSPDAATRASEDAYARPITKHWWFWTTLGAVVVGTTAIALGVGLSGGDPAHEPYYQGNAGSLRGP